MQEMARGNDWEEWLTVILKAFELSFQLDGP